MQNRRAGPDVPVRTRPGTGDGDLKRWLFACAWALVAFLIGIATIIAASEVIPGFEGGHAFAILLIGWPTSMAVMASLATVVHDDDRIGWRIVVAIALIPFALIALFIALTVLN